MASPLAINTNVGSLSAQRQLTKTSRSMQQSISRLSSGLRVQSAADNAAGMAVAENMKGYYAIRLEGKPSDNYVSS